MFLYTGESESDDVSFDHVTTVSFSTDHSTHPTADNKIMSTTKDYNVLTTDHMYNSCAVVIGALSTVCVSLGLVLIVVILMVMLRHKLFTRKIHTTIISHTNGKKKY